MHGRLRDDAVVMSASAVSVGSSVMGTDGSDALELIRVAHIAAQVGRPEDTVHYLNEAASQLYESCPDVEFSASDRALLARSLKLVVNPLRASVSTLAAHNVAASQPVWPASFERRQRLLGEYRAAKSAELESLCQRVVAISRDVFLPMANSAESRVFFNKLAGDHSRYICEIPVVAPSMAEQQAREAHAKATEQFYLAAYDEALSDLTPTHVLRLSLIHNLAIFYFEVKRDVHRAVEFAEGAYDDAVAELGVDMPDELESSLQQLASATLHAPGRESANNGREALPAPHARQDAQQLGDAADQVEGLDASTSTSTGTSNAQAAQASAQPTQQGQAPPQVPAQAQQPLDKVPPPQQQSPQQQPPQQQPRQQQQQQPQQQQPQQQQPQQQQRAALNSKGSRSKMISSIRMDNSNTGASYELPATMNAATDLDAAKVLRSIRGSLARWRKQHD